MTWLRGSNGSRWLRGGGRVPYPSFGMTRRPIAEARTRRMMATVNMALILSSLYFCHQWQK